MNYRRSLQTWGLVMLLGLGASWETFGVSLDFEDGFENIVVGDYPDENGWQVMFSGASAYVSDTVRHSGSRSFRLHGRSGWARHDYVYLDEVPDYVSYEASVYVARGGREEALVGFLDAYGCQGPAWNKFRLDGLAGTVTFSGASGTPAVTLGSYTAGSWRTVRADLDFVSNTADLWLDGGLVAQDVAIEPREFDAHYGHVTSNRWGLIAGYGPGTDAVAYFDDIYIGEGTPGDEVPEPGTWLLLACTGAFGAAVRRRRKK